MLSESTASFRISEDEIDLSILREVKERARTSGEIVIPQGEMEKLLNGLLCSTNATSPKIIKKIGSYKKIAPIYYREQFLSDVSRVSFLIFLPRVHFINQGENGPG